MTKTIAHVRLRDGVYQFEKRVPERVQRDKRRFADVFGSKALYRVSLRTKDQTEALLALAVERERFNRLVALALGKPIAERPAGDRVVTDADLASIVQRYADLKAAPFERLHRLANVDPDAAAELDRLAYESELDGEAIQATLKARNSDARDLILHPADEARRIVIEAGFNAPEGSEALGALIASVRRGMELGYERRDQLFDGSVMPAMPTLLKPALAPHQSITLRDAVERYLDARQPPAKAASETNLALRQFESVIGRKALAATTRDDFHSFVAHLAEQQVGGKTKESVVRHLSEHSIRKRLRMLSSAINHARDRGWFAGDNPASGIAVSTYAKESNRAVMPDKRRFQIEELNAVFRHPWFVGCRSAEGTHLVDNQLLSDAKFWVPICALYTGCRAAELGGLKTVEVRLEHAQPHFVIRPNEHRGTKDDRTRSVPILDALLRLGFADYFRKIASAGHDRLFPAWISRVPPGGKPSTDAAWSNGNVIRAFNRTVIAKSLGNTLPDGARREVTFHGFRGAFKALLAVTHGLPLHIVNAVAGHKDNEIDRRYIGNLSIEETYPVVRGCDYPGLIVPRWSIVLPT